MNRSHSYFSAAGVFITAFLAFLGFSRSVFALSMDSQTVYLGAGAMNHDSGIASINSKTGDKPYLSDIYSQLTLTGIFRFNDSWAFSPDFHYTPLSRATPEGGERVSILGVGARVLFNAGRGFDLHLGPGMLFYQIHGNGGSISLNNGSGYARFGIPSGSSTSRTVYLDTGFGITCDRFRIDGSVLITGLLSFSTLGISPILTLSAGLF